MVTVDQIREAVLNYVRDGNADSFVLEFSKLSFDIAQRGEPEAIRLAKLVEGKLAQAYAGHLEQKGLRGSLADLFQRIEIASSPQAGAVVVVLPLRYEATQVATLVELAATGTISPALTSSVYAASAL